MTAKCSLWTRWVQQNKRFLWLYALNGIILLWMGPIGITFRITYDLNYEVMSRIGFNYGGNLILSLLGIVAGIYGFSYLHSKKKVDFYHSQPISEENRFFNCYSSGLLCCYIPYSIVLLLDILIVKSYGILTFDMFQQILANALIGMLLYFASYQVAILMTIITGNVLYSIALTGGALVYEMLFRKVIGDFAIIRTMDVKNSYSVNGLRFGLCWRNWNWEVFHGQVLPKKCGKQREVPASGWQSYLL